MFNRYKTFAILPIFVLPFLSSNLAYSQDFMHVQTNFLNKSKLTIYGSANVTDFECDYTKNLEQDTLNHHIKLAPDAILVMGDPLALTVDKFNCGKRAMNRDFKNALQYKKHPEIAINLLKIYIEDEEPTKVDVAITITHVTRNFSINLENRTDADGDVLITGSQDLKMTDFEITPPTALFGLIKVKNDLKISFDLNLDTKTLTKIN